MSSKSLLRPQKVANAVSMTADGLSSPTNINTVSAVGYTVTWTDGASGTFQVEVCNDFVPTPSGVVPSNPVSGTWVPLVLSASVATAGTAGSAFIDIVGVSASEIRLHFVHSGGSGGTFSATIAGKGL